MHRSIFVLAAGAAACIVGPPVSASAQQVSVAVVDAWTSHDLLERPKGFAAYVSFPRTAKWSWSIAVEEVRSDRAGTGVVCGGLINPDRCPVEPLTQVGQLTLAGVGAEAALLRTTHVALVVRPQLLVGSVRSTERGTATGNTLTASKTQVGVSAALELRIFPVRRSPFGLIGGVAARRVSPLVHDQSLDAYTPFERWYSMRSLYAGVSLAL
jgi:hypothetical protein